jgi:hypothetical protein
MGTYEVEQMRRRGRRRTEGGHEKHVGRRGRIRTEGGHEGHVGR